MPVIMGIVTMIGTKIAKMLAVPLEQILEDTKLSRTIIIATGIEVKYTKNEKRTLTMAFQDFDDAGISLVAIA